jgi:3-hydroxybutyryl-CoA dehydratase
MAPHLTLQPMVAVDAAAILSLSWSRLHPQRSTGMLHCEAIGIGTSMQRTMPKAYLFEDLELGQTARLVRTVTQDDIAAFARISGDFNPVHLDSAYAASTPFKGTIAHGMLTAAYISAIFGTDLPGPGCIYVSQTLNFRAPVRPGDEVLTEVCIVDLMPTKKRVRFDCRCSVRDKTVLEGEAILMVPGRG